jgi:hypothetical protein
MNLSLDFRPAACASKRVQKYESFFAVQEKFLKKILKIPSGLIPSKKQKELFPIPILKNPTGQQR